MLTINSTSGVVVEISGTVLFAFLLILGGYIGWYRGYRSFLTITLGSIIGYLLFVNGGDLILNYINNIYTNLPRIFALLTGGDPFTAGTLDPIPPFPQLPLALRVLGFLVSTGLSVTFNRQPWYSTNVNHPGDPYNRLIGGFTGALTALIWMNAATVFWQDYVGEEGIGPTGPFSFLNGLLGILPDVREFVPFFMLLLIIILLVGIMFQLPMLFRQPPPPQRK